MSSLRETTWFTLFIVLQFSCIGQDIKYKIIDAVTKAAVPLATIKVTNRPYGVLANVHGEFSILLKAGDTVKITSVGYQQLMISAGELPKMVELNPSPSNLSNVDVRSKAGIPMLNLGPKTKGRKHSVRWGPGLNAEFVQRVVLPDSFTHYALESVILPVEKVNCFGPLLLHIYLPDSTTDKPGEEVIIKEITVSSRQIKKGKALIDVSDEHLGFQGATSLFVGVNWPTRTTESDSCVSLITMLDDEHLSEVYSRSLNDLSYQFTSFDHLHDKYGRTMHLRTFFSIVVLAYKNKARINHAKK